MNYGGGNTSIKVSGTDHTGARIDILWIKGSGSDLATMDSAGFTPLRLADITRLQDRDAMIDEEMVEYVSRSVLDPSAPRPSIETVLHAFLPYPHVDHTHPQAAIAMCCCGNGESLMRECFGAELVWVSYVRPGFALAKLARAALDANPSAKGMLLAKHGLVTWGETGRESYQRTIEFLARAEEFLEARIDQSRVFGGPAVIAPSSDDRRAAMVNLLPKIRGHLSRLVGSSARLILHWDDSESTLEFVNSQSMTTLAGTGAACPDHVMYTKFKPMVGPVSIADTDTDLMNRDVLAAIDSYVELYRTFFADNSDGVVDMLVPAPRVLLLPGLGMIAVGRDSWTARNTASVYRTAIRVCGGRLPPGATLP